MTKQIYDKHKTIWWERVNAGQNMTREDFIRLQDIAYVDRKHKKGIGVYTPTLQFQFGLGFSNIRKMCSFCKMLVKSMGLKPRSP
jgi:hypothetical protein